MKREDFCKLPIIVQEYLNNYLGVIKNYSPLTISEYAGNLHLFFRYIAMRKGLSDETDIALVDVSRLDTNFIASITLNDAFDFLNYCRNERENGAAARARKSVCLKRFYRYLETRNIIDKNPLSELDSPKIRKSLPKYLTFDECLNLLGSIDGKFKERDYCIITLFLNCGLRLSELVGLNYTDIRTDNTLRVVGKGNKERILFLNDSCVSAIQRYLAVRPNEGLKGNDKKALFISRNMRRISGRAVENIVNEFLKKAGLEGQGFSAHKLRHTAATLMYQQGNTDILLIKEILGHENLSTTQIYTHIDTRQLKSAVESNPLSNIMAPSSDKNDSEES